MRLITQQLLGAYRLLQFLDSGGFAEHTFLKTLHAVKVLHISLFDPEEQHRFLTEARLLARLHHPHIIRVQDFGIENGTPFLVMSFAPGGQFAHTPS